MKQFIFDISFPGGRSRSYVFYDADKAEAALDEFRDKDPRYNPSSIRENTLRTEAIVVDENDRYREHDISGLSYVGERDFHASNGTRKETWYSMPGRENEVKAELERAKLEAKPSMKKSPVRSLLSRGP